MRAAAGVFKALLYCLASFPAKSALWGFKMLSHFSGTCLSFEESEALREAEGVRGIVCENTS